MAAKSVVDIAIEHLDAQIADLERAKSILQLAAASGRGDSEPAPRKRTYRKRKTGLPSEQTNGE